MKTISVLIKPASSSCNLRCRYCFYADEAQNRDTASKGTMTRETMHTIIDRIDEALQGKGRANISFQGGEPTCAGLPFFVSFIEEMKKHSGIEPVWSIQTNGTLLTEEWADFFKENNFLVGVSLDGFQTNMDAFRLDAEGKGVYWKVQKAIDLLRKKKVDFNILTVVTRQLAQHPASLFSFCKEHHFDYVQLIPCLPPMDGKDDGMSLTPDLYGTFMIDFFKAWQKDAAKTGKPVNVNLFNNIGGMLQGYAPYQCGLIGTCTIQFVIEANADVYPCDFFCLDEWKLGNLKEQSFTELFESMHAKKFLSTSTCTKKPCQSCRYRNMCHGGCRRQNVCYLGENSCSYQKLLDYITSHIQ